MIFSNIVGSFLEWKGIHIYLDAVNEVDCNSCSFELVGDYGIDKNYNKRLKKKMNTGKIILRGFLKDIKNYYDTIDVVVHTSVQDDPLPTVLIEGLAKGKILIGTDVGGVREIINTSYGNIVIPPNDVNALKNAFLEVSRYSKEKIEKIKFLNKELAKKNFRLKKQINRLEKLYEVIILDKIF